MCIHDAIMTCVLRFPPSRISRLYLTARPMEDGLAEAIDEGKIGPRDDPKTRGKVLTDDFGWDKVLHPDGRLFVIYRACTLVLQAVQSLHV